MPTPSESLPAMMLRAAVVEPMRTGTGTPVMGPLMGNWHQGYRCATTTFDGKEYKDFVLKIDWRIKETTGLYAVPTVLPDGSEKKGPDGKMITTPTPNARACFSSVSSGPLLGGFATGGK